MKDKSIQAEIEVKLEEPERADKPEEEEPSAEGGPVADKTIITIESKSRLENQEKTVLTHSGMKTTSDSSPANKASKSTEFAGKYSG